MAGRKWSRRAWLGGIGAVGVTGVAGAGTWLYHQSPRFWKQYFQEMQRPIAAPPERPRPSQWPDRGLYAAWLGHATVLLKIDGFTIVTDPIFSDRAGIDLGVLTLGVKRLVQPALRLPELPPVDLVLVSHAHMDHLDIPSLRALEGPRTEVVTATATSDLFRPERYRRLTELGWDERVRIGPVEVRGFEVNHWGARMRTDRYRGYNGYLIENGRYRVLFGGDTALTNSFRALRSSQAIQLAIMPIGTYNPWRRYHCNPEQAWQMGNDAGVEFFIPVHHKTFKLSNEPLSEPMERFLQAAGNHADRIATQRIGQEFRLG